ncbi:MAG: site-specific integrase [Propionivibrio sp.]|nr:site-specific integrase [Propionivibrio sp.]
MRIGCDTDARWLSIFLDIPIPSAGLPLSEFNFRINTCARKLSGDKDLLPKERGALNALIEVSANKDREIPSSTVLPPPLFILEAVGREQFAQPVKFNLDEEGESELVTSDSGDTKFIITKPNPGFTPAERKLSTRTVLFATAEGIQMLPWSWLRPNPLESVGLANWINNTLSSNPSHSPKVLAASLIWIAHALGRSVARMLAIRIDDAPGEEWVFDRTAGSLRRFPPMRKPGWQPDTQALSWITPVAPEISILPPESSRLILLAAVSSCPDATTLRELWPAGNPSTPESAILNALQEVSGRLTGSMLAESLPQRAYELHHDAVLARLIASHPQSALAGPHSYAQWSLETVTKLLSDPSSVRPTSHWRETALGSRLALLEHALRAAIAVATRHVLEAKSDGDPIRVHNAFTAYTIVALYAATGGRPLRSPFESILHFDFNEGFVFIDDKHGGPQQDTGRVVPLPAALMAFIRRRYVPHLQALSDLLRNRAPSLAHQVTRTARLQPGGAIPLFFFLDSESLDWHEVTPSNLFTNVAIDWPLPANLFRHRLANRLRELSLDPEIIDGLFGHNEWGNGTWSTFSFRSWADDTAAARPALEASFRSLRFHPMRGLQAASLVVVNTPESIESEVSKFGARARRIERVRRFVATIRDTKRVIFEFLGERKLEELDADELDQLADRLARTEDGMPSATGAIRLAYLQRMLEKVERKTGRRHRPRGERLFVSDTPSLFNSECCGATEVIRKLTAMLPAASLKGTGAQSLGVALSLCIESRVCNRRLLEDVAEKKHFRVIRIGPNCYLEYGNVQKESDTAGRRFRITTRCAVWSVRSKMGQGLKHDEMLPPAFRDFADAVPGKPKNVRDLLESLARIVRQVNALTLPGVLCGVLSGEVNTAALGWRDAVRLSTGRRIMFADPADSASVADVTLPFIPRPPPTDVSPKAMKSAADLFKGFRLVLNEAISTRPGAKNRRRKLLSDLNVELKKSVTAEAPQAALLLANWIVFLAEPDNRRSLAPSTLLRYLAALSERFENEMLAFDFIEADSEDLTAAYERVLLSNDKPAGEYELLRLAAFHRWLRSSFDAESPDWQELPVVIPGAGISPGFIRPQDYIDTLMELQTDPVLNSREQACASMLLLLAYRFGLRRKEALGLTRKDWDNSVDYVIVTVESNRFRTLKTTSSRRQVPQVFTFHALEDELVARQLTLYAANYGSDHNHRLLHSPDPFKIAAVVLRTLKKVTGNQNINIHHARHSAANMVAINALGIRPAGWRSVDVENHVPRRLLGGDSPASRRHGWAVARFLGHASPATTCCSYLHFFFDWADDLLGIVSCEDPSNTADLQSISSLDDYHDLERTPSSRTPQSYKPADISSILEAFRIHGRGVRAASISTALAVGHSAIERWLQVLERPDKSRGANVSTEVGEIGKRLGDTSWNRLIDWAKSNPVLATSEAPALEVAEILEMVGRTKQLLAWRPEHFELLRLALDHLKINDEQYLLFGSARLHHGTIDLAQSSGFTIGKRPQAAKREGSKRTSLLQIDSVHSGPFGEPVQSRVALIFEENDFRVIRNRHQFALMLVC